MTSTTTSSYSSSSSSSDAPELRLLSDPAFLLGLLDGLEPPLAPPQAPEAWGDRDPSSESSTTPDASSGSETEAGAVAPVTTNEAHPPITTTAATAMTTGSNRKRPSANRRRTNSTRERMKNELRTLREEALDLELRLRVLQSTRRLENGENSQRPENPMAINARLRKLVQENARAAGLLRDLLIRQANEVHLSQEVPLARKAADRLYFSDHERRAIDDGLFHSLRHIPHQIDALLHFSGLATHNTTLHKLTAQPRRAGCSPVVEYHDVRVLPFPLHRVNEIGWLHFMESVLEDDSDVYIMEEGSAHQLCSKLGWAFDVTGSRVFGRGRVVMQRYTTPDRQLVAMGVWMSVSGGVLGNREIIIIDEGWALLENLLGFPCTTAKIYFRIRSHVPECASFEEYAELENLAAEVLTGYASHLDIRIDAWEQAMTEGALQSLGYGCR